METDDDIANNKLLYSRGVNGGVIPHGNIRAFAMNCAEALADAQRLIDASPDQRRLESAVLLRRLANAFGLLGADRDQREILLHMAHGLADLEIGVTAEMFKPTSIKGRPRKPAVEWQSRAFLVLAVDALTRNNQMLIDSGASPTAISEAKAREKVAREFCEKRPQYMALAKNLETWRHEFANERVSEPTAAATFRAGVALLNCGDVVPQEMAMHWIGEASALNVKM